MADIAANVEVIRQSELAKLPIFSGDAKDQFTAEQWIERIGRAIRASGWDDDQTMAFVFNALRGNALLWYDSLRRTGVNRDDWAQFRTAFLESWSTTRTARTTTVNLADLRQGQNETVNCFYPRVVKAVDDLEALVPNLAFPIPAAPWPEAFTGVAAFLAIPVADRATAAQNLVAHGATAAFNHMALNLFVSNLRPALRDEIMKLNPPTLYEAFQQAIQLERLNAEPKRSTVPAMPVEATPVVQEPPTPASAEAPEDLEKEIDALNFKLRNLKQRRDGRNGTHRNNNNNNRPGRTNGRSAATRDSVCHYCHKKGHFQAECRSRQRDGAPMVRPDNSQFRSYPAYGTPGPRPGAPGPVHQVDLNPFNNPFSYAYPAQPDFRLTEC